MTEQLDKKRCLQCPQLHFDTATELYRHRHSHHQDEMWDCPMRSECNQRKKGLMSCRKLLGHLFKSHFENVCPIPGCNKDCTSESNNDASTQRAVLKHLTNHHSIRDQVDNMGDLQMTEEVYQYLKNTFPEVYGNLVFPEELRQQSAATSILEEEVAPAISRRVVIVSPPQTNAAMQQPLKKRQIDDTSSFSETKKPRRRAAQPWVQPLDIGLQLTII